MMQDDVEPLKFHNRMPYGKHVGKTLQYVLDADPGYIVWWSNADCLPQIEDTIILWAAAALGEK